MYCQLDYLGDCLPGRISHALEELPETLDGIYERTLLEIKSTNWEFARRLFLCVAAASRPFRIEELAEFLAFDFNARPIPKFREDWRLADPLEAVLSTCSTLFVLVHADRSSVIQFSHFSVKEFLTSTRFSEKRDTISCRYHISMTSAHTLAAQACLGILLHLDENITTNSLKTFPLAGYAAEHWIDHARFEGVSENVKEGMKQLLDVRKPHFAVWVWIFVLRIPWTRARHNRAEMPLPLHGSPLHYDFEHLQDVHSRGFGDSSTLLHLALGRGHVEVARLLLGHDPDATAQNDDVCTPMLFALLKGSAHLTRLFVKYGADATAQYSHGSTQFRSAVETVDFGRLLVWHCADVTAQDNSGSTSLRSAMLRGIMDLLRLLVEHWADATAHDGDVWTPLLFVVQEGTVGLARLLVGHGADVTAQDDHGWTPLHWAVQAGSMDLASLFVGHGADAEAEDNDGSTPLGFAVQEGRDDLGLLLVEAVEATNQHAHGSTSLDLAVQEKEESVNLIPSFVEQGADAIAQDARGSPPLHLAMQEQEESVGPTRLLVKHDTNTTAHDTDESTSSHLAVQRPEESVDMPRLLAEHGADAKAQDTGGSTTLHSVMQEGGADPARFPIEYDAGLTTQDKAGSTPLHVEHCAQYEHDRLRHIWHQFLKGLKVASVGLLFYCIVTVISYWLY